MPDKPRDQTQRRDEMLISNRVHLEESRTDILLERGVNTRFDRFRDFACPPPPGEQAAKFDSGQATDGRRRLLSNERLELLGKRLVEIPFRQCAGVEVRPITAHPAPCG